MPTMARRWLSVGIILLATLASFVDKVLPGLMIEPIKISFGLSDAQVGLLTGLSFSIAVAVFSIIMGHLADRVHRGRLIACCVALWCSMTILCGLATSFLSFFVFRMGVGVGEAALKPAAYSLLPDLFPPRLLPRALGAVALGQLLSSFIAYNGGGAIYEAFRGGDSGAVAANHAWRATMICFGAAGLVIAATGLLIPDPKRAPAIRRMMQTKRVPIWQLDPELVSYGRQTLHFWFPYLIGLGLLTMFIAGYGAWLVPFMQRVHGWTIGEVGHAIGAISLVASLLGVTAALFAGSVARRFGREEAPVMLLWMLFLVASPAAVILPLLPSGQAAMACYALFLVPASAATVILPLALARTAPSHLRARVVAIVGLAPAILGEGLGPFVYGAVNDLAFGEPARIGTTMAIVTAVLSAIFLPILMIADRRYGSTVQIAEGLEPDGQ